MKLNIVPALIGFLCFVLLAYSVAPVMADTVSKIRAGLEFKAPEDSAGRPVYQR